MTLSYRRAFGILTLLGFFGFPKAFPENPSATGLRILGVEPTVLFPKSEPLRQIAILQVENSGAVATTAKVSYAIAGQTFTVQASFSPGETEENLLIPDIHSPAELTVSITGGSGPSKTLADWRQIWEPQRKWHIFIVKSSHEDLGYEGTIYQKTHDNANWIDIGKRLSDPRIPMGGDRYHYNIETMVGARDYITERGEAAWRDLVNTEILPGHMSLLGAPSGVHTHWMDYEELARMTYPARREMKDRYGVNIKTFMIVDNPSLSWSGAQAVADAGFKYVARWGQGWRTGGNNDYAHTKLPAIFWWVAPDGKHHVLFAWRSHYDMPLWYGQGQITADERSSLATFEVSKALKRIESGTELGPYPYDAVIYPQYYDHEIPHADHGLLAFWSDHFAYPTIQMTDPTDFFEYMESKYGAQIPVRSGDLNNFSADYATIDPESQGWKRTAARALPFAEGMHAIAAYLDPQIAPVTAEVARDYTLLFDYDEHSWPTLPEAGDIHVFNANYVKKHTARLVDTDSQALLDSSLKAIAEHIPNTTGSKEIAVWNSLTHDRSDPVTLDGSWRTLIDAQTGQRMATQITPEGKTVFLARDVPAYGYKVYREAAARSDAAPAPHPGLEIENEFYRIRADRTTGDIVSIFDKRLNRELVDPSAKYQFNQFIAVHKNERESLEGTDETSGPAQSIMVTEGPVYNDLTTTIEDAGTGAEIVQEVRLYKGLPRIDVRDTVRHAKMMLNTLSAERYKDNIFYAFPIDVPDGQPRAEYPSGVVRPYYDQLRWGSHDFLAANRWIDVSSKDFGITIAPWNEQIFEFGGIHYNELSIEYKPTNSHVFAYSWSNRMTGLLDLGDKDPEFTVGYSIASHAGDWDTGAAAHLGWTVASPLAAEMIPAGAHGGMNGKAQSLLSVDVPNVELTVLKESEQAGRGWIVRLVELSGKATDAVLTSSLLPVQTAYSCSLAEDDQAKLLVDHGEVHVHLLSSGMATIRLEGGPQPSAVPQVTAKAISGERVAVSWNRTPGGFYNIYRSSDPADPPTSYTLVSRSASNTFLDDHLTPMETYYYRVAAVNRDNMEGPVSSAVSVRTQAIDHEPPPAVTGLTVIMLTGNRRIVAWPKSTAGDIAEYVVYRSEGSIFNPLHMQQVSVQRPTGYSIETYIDPNGDADRNYSYFVLPVDWAGNRSKLP
jgi:Glycosyl hydrolases family 38 C-terminal domain/Glycosyl hydrolases family 38 C-terminal beta sandwich domain